MSRISVLLPGNAVKKCCFLLVLGLLFCAGTALADTLVIPAGTISIEDEAFRGNAGFSDLIIQEGTTSIGPLAFADCGTLTVRLPDSLTYIAEDAFKNTTVKIIANDNTYAWEWAEQHHLEPDLINGFSYEIVDGAVRITRAYSSDGTVVVPGRIRGLPVRIIGSYAFSNRDVIRVILPEGITTLEKHSFYSSANLKEIVIPGSVESIGEGAFSNSSLTDVVLCNGVNNIGTDAFRACGSLTSISIPGSVESIGDSAFYHCAALKTVLLEDGVAGIGNNAFTDCDALLSITIPGSVKNIGEHAFYNCDALRSVTLQAGVETIGKYAFNWCKVLSRFTVGDGLKTIDEAAFSNCTALEELTLPDGLTSIGANAFSSCTSLASLSLSGGITIGELAFGYDNMEVTFRGGPLTLHESALFSGSFLVHCTAVPEGIDSSLKYGAKALVWDTGNQTVADDTKSASDDLKTRNSNNAGDEYSGSWNGRCAETTTSYLVPGTGGAYTRVQYISGKVRIEEYAADGTMTWSKDIAAELPLWGGFFSGTEYNFLVYGQENRNEDDSVEIMRVIKYTKNWNRVSHASVFGANTTIPFRAGSLDMAQSGNILYILTSHQMYKSEDGKNHQANMGYDIYIPNMQFVRQGYQIGGDTYEYVSHSFNQKVLIDGKDIIKVNHGDAYPRSIVLLVAGNSAGSISLQGTRKVDILKISGDIGNNTTGAALGGIAASSTHYLVSGNSIDQSLFGSSSQRNIFIGTVPRNDVTQENVSLKWITSHASSGRLSVSAPHLVKISSFRFLLLWKEGSSDLKYVFLNASGDMTTEILSANGNISDCRPIVNGGQVTWYVSSGSKTTYYSISTSAPYALTAR